MNDNDTLRQHFHDGGNLEMDLVCNGHQCVVEVFDRSNRAKEMELEVIIVSKDDIGLPERESVVARMPIQLKRVSGETKSYGRARLPNGFNQSWLGCMYFRVVRKEVETC